MMLGSDQDSQKPRQAFVVILNSTQSGMLMFRVWPKNTKTAFVLFKFLYYEYNKEIISFNILSIIHTYLGPFLCSRMQRKGPKKVSMYFQTSFFAQKRTFDFMMIL